MPPKPLPLTAPAASASSTPNLAKPSAISTAVATAIASVTASTAATKKSQLKRKSSTGSTDSKSVKKRKTNVKAAKPGASTVKPLSSIIKSKEDAKRKASSKLLSKQSSTSASPKSASKTASKTASPTKTSTSSISATNKSKTTKSTNPTPQLTKLQKAQQTKRDITNLDSIEQAFRQDREVWCPPEPTGGWMYRTGGAEVGGNSWMGAVNGKENQQNQQQRLRQQQQGGLLFDETLLLQNALSYNNLTLSSLTPEAYASLLEQARRYALELLVDAQDYAMHASRTSVASLIPADLLLAAEMRGDVDGVPSTLPRYEEMMDYASDVNRKPLPPIPVDCYNGVALPPVEEQLTFRTFDVVNGATVVQKMMKGGELPLASVEVGLVKRSSGNGMDSILTKKSGSNEISGGESPTKPSKIEPGKNTASYGAGKGRQIAIHLKDNTGEKSSLGASNKTSEESSGKLAASKAGSKNKRKLTEL
ncbi:hypothetical protein HJC23_011650 [Cyclotella cryptica]|uniref:Transcription initiation factor TFIID subunit 8 n=1 Tax=Cyclotella cryptica TaxID=29204 RepID=A0ABD3NQ67_9STRA|eukprot:CCRYP_020829-RA/>CCRYP_020829-RA protein AED:0.07 eAED:0.07 QI:69/-1/1/1/-1/1/1/121/477